MKNTQTAVHFLVPADNFDEAKTILSIRHPGEYVHAGESIKFSEADKKPIAMLEIDFMVRLPLNIGLQTSQLR